MGGSKAARCRSCLVDNLLIILMIIGIATGISLGLNLRRLEGWEFYQKRKIFYLRLPGDLFLNMLKMLIIPLVFSSTVSSLAALNVKASGKMGLWAVIYYICATTVAIVIGVVTTISIRPGTRGINSTSTTETAGKADLLVIIFDLVRNSFPDNLVDATYRMQTTVTRTFKYSLANTSTSMHGTEELCYEAVEPFVAKTFNMNVIGLVVFSVFFGGVISKMGEMGKPLIDLFEALHQATMVITRLVIWTSPVGIIFLVAANFLQLADPVAVFAQLGFFMITILSALAIHGLLFLPFVYWVFVRKNPYRFMHGISKALITAWATASSSATLPITMNCLTEHNRLNVAVVKFVVPTGASITMQGAALYQAVSAIFIAQMNSINLDIGQIITISLMSVAASTGSSGVPSSILVTMSIVLTTVGLPVDDIALILAVDWFIDRFRTAVNVLGDAFAAGIVDHLSKNNHSVADEEPKTTNDCEEITRL